MFDINHLPLNIIADRRNGGQTSLRWCYHISDCCWTLSVLQIDKCFSANLVADMLFNNEGEAFNVCKMFSISVSNLLTLIFRLDNSSSQSPLICGLVWALASAFLYPSLALHGMSSQSNYSDSSSNNTSGAS